MKIEVTSLRSLEVLIPELLLNGYKVTAETFWKEFPIENEIDHFEIIFDKIDSISNNSEDK